jgi:PAS domain S-box-containing protein
MSTLNQGNLTASRKVLVDDSERLRLIEENVRDYAIFTIDVSGCIATWNLGAERILRYVEAEIEGQPLALLFTPEDRAANLPEAEMYTARETGRSEDERWHMRKDGSRFWASGILTALRDENGALRGYAKILRDASDRKHEQERAVQILESITNAFFALDQNWRFTYINKQAEPLLRRSREELLGKSVWDEFPEAVGSTFYTAYHHAVAEQVTVNFEEYYAPLDAWFSVKAYPGRDGLSIYFENINDRKRAEERQRQRERRAAFGAEVGAALSRNDGLEVSLQTCVEAMVRHLDAAFARVWTLNAETNMLELRASAGLYTHLDGAHSRLPVGQYKIGRIAADRQPHLTNAVIGDPQIGDQEWAAREGMAAFAGYPLLVAGQVVGVMAMFARQTIQEDTFNALALAADALAQTIQRKHVETQIQTLNERLQRLVTETHHRVKNNLQVMSAMIDLHTYSGEEMVPISELQRISAQIRALSSLHDILTQATKQEGVVEGLPVRPMLERLLPLLQSAAGPHEIHYEVEDGLLSVKRATALSLLVNELVSNALKHGTGRVMVRFTTSGETARLIVENDGPGFPADFDPVTAANTGLDLIDAFARHDLRGSVRYTNNPDGGARVIVEFPLDA